MADPITREELRALLVEACAARGDSWFAIAGRRVTFARLLAILDEGRAACIPALPISEEDERLVDDLVKRKTAERARASLSVGDIVRDPGVLRAGDVLRVASLTRRDLVLTERRPRAWFADHHRIIPDDDLRAGHYHLISKAPTTEDDHE